MPSRSHAGLFARYLGADWGDGLSTRVASHLSASSAQACHHVSVVAFSIILRVSTPASFSLNFASHRSADMPACKHDGTPHHVTCWRGCTPHVGTLRAGMLTYYPGARASPPVNAPLIKVLACHHGGMTAHPSCTVQTCSHAYMPARLRVALTSRYPTVSVFAALSVGFHLLPACTAA